MSTDTPFSTPYRDRIVMFFYSRHFPFFGIAVMFAEYANAKLINGNLDSEVKV